MKKIICSLLLAVLLMGMLAGCEESVQVTTTQPPEEEIAVWNNEDKATEFLTAYFNATTVEALTPLFAADTPETQIQDTAVSFAETKDMIGLDNYMVEKIRYVATEEEFDIYLCQVVAMYKGAPLVDYDLGTFITLLTRDGDRYVMPYVENNETAKALYNRYSACICNMGISYVCKNCGYLLGEETGGICDLCLSEGVKDSDASCGLCFGEGYTILP